LGIILLGEIMIFNDLIGRLMKIYRKSSLHSEKMGHILAKALSITQGFRNKKSVIREIGGIQYNLDLGEIIDSSLFYSGTFEEPEERIIESIIKQGMIIFDIGANVGYHTFRMASLSSPNGVVYAFEPTQWAYDRLMLNAKLNPDIKNIRFNKLALSEKDEGNQNLYIQSSYRNDGKQENKLEKIEFVRLDTYFEKNKIANLDFIKIDVDGYEKKVISGAINSLKKFKPIILFEICPSLMIKNGDLPSDLVHLLESIGYTFESEERNKINNLIALCENIKKNSSAMVLAIPS
jgi:FkbM family methyltransferase